MSYACHRGFQAVAGVFVIGADAKLCTFLLGRIGIQVKFAQHILPGDVVGLVFVGVE